MRDAKPAGVVLVIAQLEAVIKALASIGEKPSPKLLGMIRAARSKAGIEDQEGLQCSE